MLSKNTNEGAHVLLKLQYATKLSIIFLQINLLLNEIYVAKVLDKFQVFIFFLSLQYCKASIHSSTVE